MVKPLHDTVGIVSGLMTTIHAYTIDQCLTDVSHADLRRARSATQSMIPTKTGAAAAVGMVSPELDGNFDGFAMRVPTLNVSVVDLTFESKRKLLSKRSIKFYAWPQKALSKAYWVIMKRHLFLLTSIITSSFIRV